MKSIPLTRGQFTTVDLKNYDIISQHNWFYTHYGYAGRSATKEEIDSGHPKVILMHRYLMDAPKGIDVDHKDGNRLNNQLENLRLCSRKENLRNQAKVMSTKRGRATSPYKGVYWANDRRKWRSTIFVDNRRVSIGSFDDEDEAALAYNRFAKKHFGEFARLNIV